MDEDFGIGFVVGALFVFLAMIISAAILWPVRATEYRKDVCHYLDGTYHGDVCVKDGRVVKIGKVK